MLAKLGERFFLFVISFTFFMNAEAFEVQVTSIGEGPSVQVRILHQPQREPLAAVNLRLRLKPGLQTQSTTVSRPETGPWAQFLPTVSTEGLVAHLWAMAPTAGARQDSGNALIAQFDWVLTTGAGVSPGPRLAADIMDSVTLIEAYAPDGGPLQLQPRLTTSLARSRQKAEAPVFSVRGPQRTVVFNLARAQRVNAWISDMRGRKILVLLDRKLAAGVQEVTWNGKWADGQAPTPGTYLLHLESGTFRYDRKLEVGR